MSERYVFTCMIEGLIIVILLWTCFRRPRQIPYVEQRRHSAPSVYHNQNGHGICSFFVLLSRTLDCVHTIPANFENGEKVTVAKFELAFTRYRHNLKTVGNWTVKSRCMTLMSKKSTYTLRIDQSRSKSIEKCSLYIIVQCSHDAVSNLWRLGFRFQIYRFRNMPAKNVPFSCEREVYPSHFSPFSKCAGIV